MKEREDRQEFEAQAKALFDDSVDALDAGTLSRLNRGRQAALAELGPGRTSLRRGRWLPAAGVAAAALVTVMLVRGPAGVDPVEPAVTASDFELLMNEPSLEMLEDLEFYSWLDARDLETDGDVG
jgi:hypothetical protein